MASPTFISPSPSLSPMMAIFISADEPMTFSGAPVSLRPDASRPNSSSDRNSLFIGTLALMRNSSRSVSTAPSSDVPVKLTVRRPFSCSTSVELILHPASVSSLARVMVLLLARVSELGSKFMVTLSSLRSVVSVMKTGIPSPPSRFTSWPGARVKLGR